MNPVLTFLVYFALLLIFGAGLFAFGWNAATSRSRAARKDLETAVGDLEVQVAYMNEQLSSDANRAAIDIGKRYVINQIQATLARIMEAVTTS